MGYNTTFYLRVFYVGKLNEHAAQNLSQPIFDEVVDRDSRGLYGITLRDLVTQDGSDTTRKWYEFEREMQDISERYPEHLFELEGHGEDAEDIWRAYFLGGRQQLIRAKLSWGDVDIGPLLRQIIPSPLAGMEDQED